MEAKLIDARKRKITKRFSFLLVGIKFFFLLRHFKVQCLLCKDGKFEIEAKVAIHFSVVIFYTLTSLEYQASGTDILLNLSIDQCPVYRPLLSQIKTVSLRLPFTFHNEKDR